MAHIQGDRVDSLLEGNDEYRQLKMEHRQCEEKLEELYSRSFLSEEDQLETARIKRRKLFLKDRMTAIVRSQAQQASV
jgi:hypothetical protein